MNVAGTGKIAGILATLYGSDGTVLENAKSKEGRELLLTNGNIISLIESMIVEPRLLVSNRLRNHALLDKILERQMLTFAGIYTIGLQYLVEQLGVEVNSALSLMASSQKRLSKMINDSTVECFVSGVVDGDEDFNMEDITKEDHSDKNQQTLFREMKVALKRDSDTVNIKIIVKASVKFFDVSNLELAIEDNDPNTNSIINRLDMAQSGEISWSQFWFPLDMIKRHRKRRLMDSDELIKDMREMSEDAYTKLMTHGAVGFGKNYRFIIINNDEKARLEHLIKSPLVKGGSEKLLNMTNSLGLVVMDDDHDMVTTFINGGHGALFNNYKSFKGGKDDSTDKILNYLAGMR